jgi:glycosyltransferase involved in cell wall biosynthesis
VAAGDVIQTISSDLDVFVQLRAHPRHHHRDTMARQHVKRSSRLRAEHGGIVTVEVNGEPARPQPTQRGRVSCLMPTFGRASFLAHAIDCFLVQDYPNAELVIVDDSPESAEPIVPQHKSIMYIRLRPRRSIGVKRNLAAEAASGDYLMSWDDDDWSSPRRISHQVAPLLAGVSDVTALTTGFILVQHSRQFWRQKPGRSGTLFQQGVNWGTLAWTRAAQSRGIRFPDSSLAEDVAFKDALVRHGARLQILDNPGVYVYVRHGANTWNFPEHKMLADDQWLCTDTPEFFPPSARVFYGVAS